MSNLKAFYYDLTGLIYEGRAVDAVDFSKAFNSLSHINLIENLMKYGMNKWTVRWIEN